jgi:hypothetical protein
VKKVFFLAILGASLHIDSTYPDVESHCGRVINPWVRLANIDFIYDPIAYLFQNPTFLTLYSVDTLIYNLAPPPSIQIHHKLSITLRNNLHIPLDLKLYNTSGPHLGETTILRNEKY